MERKRIEKSAAGRPRSAAAHDAILTASIALIREVGYDAVTIEGIAARAGVGKATIYRHWRDRDTLIVEALRRLVRTFPDRDTGSTRRDLVEVMRDTSSLYWDPASKELLSGLVAAMARNPTIADAVRDGFVAARRDVVRRALARGVARGELRKGLNYELVLDLLNGPPFYRFLITGTPIDERLTRALVETVLRAFAPT